MTDCTCPSELLKDPNVDCNTCMKYTIQKTDGEHCCVFCEKGAKNGGFICADQSLAGSDECPKPTFKCESSDPEIWVEVTLVVLSFSLLLVLIMTRKQWIPTIKQMLWNLRQKFRSHGGREGYLRASTASMENLMGGSPRDGDGSESSMQQPTVVELDHSSTQPLPADTLKLSDESYVALHISPSSAFGSPQGEPAKTTPLSPPVAYAMVHPATESGNQQDAEQVSALPTATALPVRDSTALPVRDLRET